MRKGTANYFIVSHNLKRECQCCHNTHWMGKEIPLEVHHIDGNHENNDDSNIMILCPNCHYFTDNYKAKNRKYKSKEYFCTRCGKKLFGYAKTGLCIDCVREVERENSVCNNPEKLKEDISNLKSYGRVAKLYGVSDKIIAKWCRRFGIIKD